MPLPSPTTEYRRVVPGVWVAARALDRIVVSAAARTPGVAAAESVVLLTTELRVRLRVTVEYDTVLPRLADALRGAVDESVARMTGLSPDTVDIEIVAVREPSAGVGHGPSAGHARTAIAAAGEATRGTLMGLSDKAENAADRVIGKVKEKVGEARDDEKLEAEGRSQQAKGDVKDAGEKVKDAFKR